MRTSLATALLLLVALSALEVTAARYNSRRRRPTNTRRGTTKTQSDVAYELPPEYRGRRYARSSASSTSPCSPQDRALRHAAFPDGALHCVQGFARLPGFVGAKGQGRCYRVVSKVEEGRGQRDMHPYKVTREQRCQTPDPERRASNLGPEETLDLCDEHVGCDEYLPRG